jgi:hypothetical protein
VIDGCQFTAEDMLPTRSELVRMGVPRRIVEKLTAWSNQGGTTEQIAGQVAGAFQAPAPDAQPSMERVRCADCVIWCDDRGDGVNVPVRVLMGLDDEVLLMREPAPVTPWVLGTCILLSHSAVGRSLWDALAPIEIQKSKAIQQALDNMDYGNNALLGVVDGRVNPDDVLNRAPGKALRMKAQGDVFPIPVPDLIANTMGVVGYFDRARSERAGASLDLQTASAQIAGDTAAGVERQYGSRELVADQMMRVFAATAGASVYRLAHAVMRLWSPGKITTTYKGKWIEVDPAQWRERTEVSIVPGATKTERSRRAQTLLGVIAQQTAAMQAGLGGQLTDLSKMHAALVDWAFMGGTDGLRYWSDPESPKAQQAAQQQAMSAAAQAKNAQDNAELLVGIQANADVAKSFAKLNFDYWNARLNAEIEEAKLAGTATKELQLVELQGQAKEMQLGAQAQAATVQPKGGATNG